MRNTSIFLVLTGVFWVLSSAMTKPAAIETIEPIAVIELFSSQGCSSCPPADKLLSKIIANSTQGNSKIFALSFHVDYWDRLGWKDPFSNKQFSERQAAYADKMSLNSSYTPQAIVNGTAQFVGSDETKLDKAIEQALRIKPETAFTKLELSYTEKNLPVVHYELAGNYAHCSINIALLSRTETTHIKRGENSGITLVNNNVVYQLASVAATQSGTLALAASPLPLKNNLRIIAYIQNTGTLKITGAAQSN